MRIKLTLHDDDAFSVWAMRDSGGTYLITRRQFATFQQKCGRHDVCKLTDQAGVVYYVFKKDKFSVYLKTDNVED